MSEIHWSSSSSSSLLVKEGTMALLYFGHVSIHLDHSNSCVLNIILLNLVLKCKLYYIIFGLFHINLFILYIAQISRSTSPLLASTLPVTFHSISSQLKLIKIDKDLVIFSNINQCIFLPDIVPRTRALLSPSSPGDHVLH